jgi:hypothetical protein
MFLIALFLQLYKNTAAANVIFRVSNMPSHCEICDFDRVITLKKEVLISFETLNQSTRLNIPESF